MLLFHVGLYPSICYQPYAFFLGHQLIEFAYKLVSLEIRFHNSFDMNKKKS